MNIVRKRCGDTLKNVLTQSGCETVEEAYPIIGASFKDMFEETNELQSSKFADVNENGGFYIGRYEASEEDGNVAVKGDATPWNNIDYTTALDKAKNMYSSFSGKNFESSLLTGAAWDRTLGWLEETGEVSSFEIVGDSKTWGNYSDDTFSNNTGLANTGEYSQTEKNNIYDLAGNLEEWTSESVSADYRVIRGR